MAELFGQLWNKRKNISSASSDESSISPETKKTKQHFSPMQQQEDMGATLKAILAKLEELDTIESAVKKIEAKLESLEERTQSLEDFQTTAKKDRRAKRQHELHWKSIQGQDSRLEEGPLTL